MIDEFLLTLTASNLTIWLGRFSILESGRLPPGQAYCAQLRILSIMVKDGACEKKYLFTCL